MGMIHRAKRSIDNNTKLPEPPSHFDDIRVSKYYELATKVEGMKILEETDYDAFCILVDNLVIYKQAADNIMAKGVIVEGRNGDDVRNPASTVQKNAWSIIQPLLVAFSLTPAARAAMNIVKDTVSVVDEFLPNQ